MGMIHSSNYKPVVIPYGGNCARAEIDRVQDMAGTTALAREKIREVGREGLVGWREGTPNVGMTLRQLEYGSFEFWRKLGNLPDSDSNLDLAIDLKTPMVDIVGYKTDDDGNFLGTIWYPKQRVSGFGLNIGDPEAIAERSFTLVGEDDIFLQNNNKYLINLQRVIASGENGVFNIVLGASGEWVNYPTPIEDPDNAGVFILRITRTRSGIATELTITTDYTYTFGTKTISILSANVGDSYKVWYSATTYITGSNPFVENDSDLSHIEADSVTVLLGASNELALLQSAGIDISYDRQDVKEIGNADVVARGIRDKTFRITLGRMLENFTFEEVLRNKVGLSYGKIDVRKFVDNLTLLVKCYTDNTKGTFSIGFKFENLAATNIDAGTPLSDYVNRGISLEGEEGIVSVTEGDIA